MSTSTASTFFVHSSPLFRAGHAQRRERILQRFAERANPRRRHRDDSDHQPAKSGFDGFVAGERAGTVASHGGGTGHQFDFAGNGGAGQALSAASSDSSVVSATDANATSPATYTINSVTTVASAASENSLVGYANSTTTPVSSTGNMELVVGSQDYQIALTSATNNLTGLASQINSLNAGVTASVLTTATNDYLSVSANSTGATTLQIVDDPSSTSNPTGTNTQWMTAANQGTDADFYLNNIEVKQPSNTVNDVIPGYEFHRRRLRAPPPTTLSLASDPTQLTYALQDVVTNYNSLRTALNGQEGPAAGALSGDTSMTQLEAPWINSPAIPIPAEPSKASPTSGSPSPAMARQL